MNLRWTSLSVPKAGHGPAENEDAYAVAKGRACVCDGASEGWASRAWAEHLSKAYLEKPPSPVTFSEWLGSVRSSYSQTPTSAVSWYAEEKQAAGAFATLLGLTFSRGKDGGVKYHAVAVGDSSLFHLREDKLVARFPIEKAEDFGNRPRLIASLGDEPQAEYFAGRAEAGDRFYLLTDALAEWFLRQAEAGESPWQVLDAVTSAADATGEFAHWVDSLRAGKVLKNDDSTVVRARIS